tara:strand:+ start:462 stop:1157 length:696 start_codon:yes stop_codon:yes gene_type:complete
VPRGVKKKAHEKLTNSNIQHVIELLDAESPITKKEACAILNISYNTKRLSTIIEDYIDKKAYRDKRKAENRGKPASKHEIITAIEGYLAGSPVSEIASYMFRSPSFVKNIIERVGVPQKLSKDEEKAGTYMLPEQCVSEEFSENEIVWSVFYNSAAIVTKEDTRMNYVSKYGAKCYEVYVYEMVEWKEGMYANWWAGTRPLGFNAHQLAYELGSLKHLVNYGVNIEQRLRA